jgi:hypothetical protein
MSNNEVVADRVLEVRCSTLHTSVLYGGEMLALRSGRFTSGERVRIAHCIGSCIGFRVIEWPSGRRTYPTFVNICKKQIKFFFTSA